jgi:hypothetical protein
VIGSGFIFGQRHKKARETAPFAFGPPVVLPLFSAGHTILLVSTRVRRNFVPLFQAQRPMVVSPEGESSQLFGIQTKKSMLVVFKLPRREAANL